MTQGFFSIPPILQKRLFQVAALVVAGGLIWLAIFANRVATQVSITSANLVCNQVLAAGQPAEQVVEYELRHLMGIDLDLDIDLDYEQRVVTASLYGLGESVSEHRPGYGCAITADSEAQSLAYYPSSGIKPQPLPESAVPYPAVQAAVEVAFAERGEGVNGNPFNLRGIVVMHRGQIVAEQYAAPYDKDMRQASFSMAKSVHATLWAIADANGLADLDAPARVPEWAADDPRAEITNRNFINMASGLDFGESYAIDGDLIQMMTSPDTGAYGSRSALIAEPGTRWFYSSADTNTASRSLRLSLAEHGLSTPAFAESELFRPIGGTSYVLAADQTGTFIGSSLTYATARDWARLGQLYLQEGEWNGEQVVPSEFITSIQEPHPDSKGQYKHGMWLNQEAAHGGKPNLPGMPTDAYYFGGYLGQKVVIVPSSDMVIVRLGASRGDGVSAEINKFLGALHELTLEDAVERDTGGDTLL